MGKNIICLNPDFSTTRRLYFEKPTHKGGDSLSHNGVEKIERGLRAKGYFKESYPRRPLISIITVVRNAKEELVRTLKSVIRQTYDNIEYIIVDGASTDGTIDVIKAFEDSIDCWITEKDKSVYEGMNKAIDLARGVWVNFMNAGDWFCNADIVQRIVESVPENVEFIYGDFYFLFRRNQLVPVKAKPLDTLWRGMAFSHQSLFVKTDVLKKYRFNRRYKIASDYHLIFQLVKNNHPFHYSNKFVAFYSYGGLSINKQVKSLWECWRIARKFEKNENFKIDRYYIPFIWERMKRIAEEKWQRRFGISNKLLQQQYNMQSPLNTLNILDREPFLIDSSYYNSNAIYPSYSDKPIIRSLLQWIVYPPFQFDDVEYQGNMVIAGKLTTDISAQILTDFLEIEDHKACYRVECHIKDDSLVGFRVLQVRCYNKDRENINILRFKLMREKEIIMIEPQLAHNFFHGQTDNHWKKVGGYILGSYLHEELGKALSFEKDEIITKLPDETKYIRVCFLNEKNDKAKTTAWFYSPVIIKLLLKMI